MQSQELRDRTGRLLGTLYLQSDRQELRDRTGTYLGTFDAKANETRDRHGRLIGAGNLLMTLLPAS
jgi:hypothetical protein